MQIHVSISQSLSTQTAITHNMADVVKNKSVMLRNAIFINLSQRSQRASGCF